MTADELRTTLQPFRDGELSRWRSLPEITAELPSGVLGGPTLAHESVTTAQQARGNCGGGE